MSIKLSKIKFIFCILCHHYGNCVSFVELKIIEYKGLLQYAFSSRLKTDCTIIRFLESLDLKITTLHHTDLMWTCRSVTLSGLISNSLGLGCNF